MKFWSVSSWDSNFDYYLLNPCILLFLGVIDCWDSFSRNERVEKYIDDNHEVLQQADCYVKGLSAKCFHDPCNGEFPWVEGLEANVETIQRELRTYLKAQGEAKAGQPSASWLGPRDASGVGYGPEWKTLGLQDRGVWDSASAHYSYFPETIELLTKYRVPSCEAFFARQGPSSGIKPHTDKNNFIITAHLGLEVPEGDCWIKVGNEKHFWKEGKICIFDTSLADIGLHAKQFTQNRHSHVHAIFHLSEICSPRVFVYIRADFIYTGERVQHNRVWFC